MLFLHWQTVRVPFSIFVISSGLCKIAIGFVQSLKYLLRMFEGEWNECETPVVASNIPHNRCRCNALWEMNIEVIFRARAELWMIKRLKTVFKWRTWEKRPYVYRLQQSTPIAQLLPIYVNDLYHDFCLAICDNNLWCEASKWLPAGPEIHNGWTWSYWGSHYELIVLLTWFSCSCACDVKRSL